MGAVKNHWHDDICRAAAVEELNAEEAAYQERVSTAIAIIDGLDALDAGAKMIRRCLLKPDAVRVLALSYIVQAKIADLRRAAESLAS